MTSITHKSTLVWHDGPEVFEGRSLNGGHYIAAAAAPDDEPCFVVVGVPPLELKNLRSGCVDLRTVMSQAGSHEWYLAPPDAHCKEGALLKPQKGPLRDEKLLPGHDFFLYPDPPKSNVVEKARELGRLVVELVAEPVSSERLGLDSYIHILTDFRSIVSHAFTETFKGHPQTNLLSVLTPALPGSPRVFLAPTEQTGLLGQTNIGRALEKNVDNLFEDVERSVSESQKSKSRLSHAYWKFLRTLTEQESSFHYSWAEPFDQNPIRRSVPLGTARRVYDKLLASGIHSSRDVQITGVLYKCNRKSQTWGLATESDKIVVGSPNPEGPNLDGLTIGQRYRFTCRKETGVDEATGRENATYFLLSYEPVIAVERSLEE